MNIKKIISVLLIVLLIGAVFAGCGTSNNGKSGDTSEAASDTQVESNNENSSETADISGGIIDDIKKGGKLIVATEAGFPPMEYYEGDKIVGIDVDIVSAIAEELGVEVEFLELEFNSLIPSLNSGKAHLVAAGLSYDEERAQKVDYSDIYFKSMQVILTTKDSGIKSEEDLAGKKVGVQLNTTGDYYVSDNIECEVKQFNKYMQAVEELKNGSIDAIVVDNVPADVFASQNEQLEVVCNLFEEEYGLAINKDQKEFLTVINGIINKLIDDGKIDEFQAKHIENI